MAAKALAHKLVREQEATPMAAKRKRTHEPSPEEQLKQRTEELSRLRQFVDDSVFGGDQTDVTGEIGMPDQHPGDVSDFTFQRELMETTREILDEEATQTRDALQRRANG